jgi:glycosyltransferase involved in cell wall biosynthesis
MIQKTGISKNVEYLGFLPYSEMLQELLKSDILLMMVNEKRHVPGKLFEYLRTGKPIIAFGNDNEEVQKILKEANAGRIFNFNENVGEFFNPGSGYKKFRTDFSVIKKYDRKNIAEELSRILDLSTE